MKDLLFKNSFLPLYHYIYKRRHRINCYEKLTRKDYLSREDLYFIQWKKLKKLVNFCYEKIPYYQMLFKSLDIHPNDIKSVRDYQKIPEFNNFSIVENKKALLNPELCEKNLLIDYSGGSTGMPIRIYRSFEDQEYIYALRARANSWCGYRFNDRVFWLITDKKYIKPNNYLAAGFEAILNRKNIAKSKNICPESMNSWIQQIKKYKPVYLFGYSSLLEEFSVYLSSQQIKINGIKGVFSTVEPLIQRELIARAFNAPVFDEYGYSEVPCIAHECSKGSMHLNIDEYFIEFEETDDDYEAKKLICTPLSIYSMPILRYNTGDISVFREENSYCECGLPYPTIKLKVGKMNDNLVSINGKLVSGVSVASYVSAITSGIRQFQIVQKDLFHIKVKISAHNAPIRKNENNIRKLFYELMDTNFLKINFEYYDKIPPDINGDFRPVISNISNNLNYKANIRSKVVS